MGFSNSVYEVGASVVLIAGKSVPEVKEKRRVVKVWLSPCQEQQLSLGRQHEGVGKHGAQD